MEKKKQAHRAIERTLSYQQTFNTEHGRRVVYDLMKVCHMLSPSYVQGDAYQSAFREGERNVCLRILTALKISPEELRERMKEGEQNEY